MGRWLNSWSFSHQGKRMERPRTFAAPTHTPGAARARWSPSTARIPALSAHLVYSSIIYSSIIYSSIIYSSIPRGGIYSAGREQPGGSGGSGFPTEARLASPRWRTKGRANRWVNAAFDE